MTVTDEEKMIRQWAAKIGKKGGEARAQALSPERRSEIARKGGKASAKAMKAKRKESK